MRRRVALVLSVSLLSWPVLAQGTSISALFAQVENPDPVVHRPAWDELARTVISRYVGSAEIISWAEEHLSSDDNLLRFRSALLLVNAGAAGPHDALGQRASHTLIARVPCEPYTSLRKQIVEMLGWFDLEEHVIALEGFATGPDEDIQAGALRGLGECGRRYPAYLARLTPFLIEQLDAALAGPRTLTTDRIEAAVRALSGLDDRRALDNIAKVLESANRADRLAAVGALGYFTVECRYRLRRTDLDPQGINTDQGDWQAADDLLTKALSDPDSQVRLEAQRILQWIGDIYAGDEE